MHRPRLALISIAFLAFVSLGLPDGVLGVAWPSVRHTFGLPVSSLGLLLLGGTCGYLIASFNSGAIVRRLGIGKLLTVSSVLMACASAGFALAPAWPVMVALGVLTGLGAGAIDACINAYAAHHFSPRLINWLHAFYGVGATLGPLLMTGVLSLGLAWRWGYAVNATLLAGMTVCFLATLRLWDAPAAPGEESAATAPVSDPAPEANALQPGTVATLKRPVVLSSVLLFLLYTGLEVAAGQWTYTLFTEGRGIAPAVAGVWVGVYWASLTVGRIVFGTFAAHWPPLAVVRATMLAAPLGAVLIWLNGPAWSSFAGLALMGFCFAPMFPLLVALMPGRVGKAAAHQVIGFEISAACLGAAIVPGVTGLLAKWVGLEVIGPTLFVVAVLLLVTQEAVARAAGVAYGERRIAPLVPAPDAPGRG